MKISDIITENDGDTICPGRIFLIIGALVFLGLACYNASHFNAMNFGTGYGSLLGGGLTGIWAKSKTDKP